MIKQNLHTHSTYCDGKNSLEEIVKQAIKMQFSILGFSSHGNVTIPGVSQINSQKYEDYLQEVRRLKTKYAEQINIYLGIEEDSWGTRYHGLDYVIGSCHIVKGLPIDHNEGTFKLLLENVYQGNFYQFLIDYFQELIKLTTYSEVDIIGHFDLYAKYNEQEKYFKFADAKYLELAYQCLDKIVASGKIIEVNTGAIARGYRTRPYPHYLLLKYLAQKEDAKIILNSDCHNKEYLDCYFKESLELLKELGFKELMVLTESGFRTESIDKFK